MTTSALDRPPSASTGPAPPLPPSSRQSEEHPMVSVSEALYVVLSETARIGEQRQNHNLHRRRPRTSSEERVDLDWSWTPQQWQERLLGRTLSRDVMMQPPEEDGGGDGGYPPYAASIMDGYAIRTHDLQTLIDSSSSATNPAATTWPETMAASKSTATTSVVDGTADHEDLAWTHVVLDRIHAGRPDPPVPAREVSAVIPTVQATDFPPPRSSVLFPAYYVTTGARVPPGFDVVLPFEEDFLRVSPDGTRLFLRPTPVDVARYGPGTWIRRPGADLPAGSVVIPAHSVIGPVELGLIMQAACPHLFVVTLPEEDCITVGVLSTGRELWQPPANVSPTDALSTTDVATSQASTETPSSSASWWDMGRQGYIPDVNRPMLMALISSWFPSHDRVQVCDCGVILDDDLEAWAGPISTALERCQILVTTGGASRGETDLMETVLLQRWPGRLHVGRLHMKPGKPTTVVTIPAGPGRDTDRLVLALPGNPVSALVCAHLLLHPCLELLVHGPDSSMYLPEIRPDDGDPDSDDTWHRIAQQAWVHPEIRATLTHDIALDIERPEYHRVTLQPLPAAEAALVPTTPYRATSTGVQRSSRLVSLRDAQGLVVLPQGTAQKRQALAGESYPVLLLGPWWPTWRRRLQDSCHALPTNSSSSSTTWIKVGVVRVVPAKSTPSVEDDDDYFLQVLAALSLSGDSNSSPPISGTDLVWTWVCPGSPSEIVSQLQQQLQQGPTVDLVLVITEHRLSWVDQWAVAQAFRQELAVRPKDPLLDGPELAPSQVAEALALYLRRAAARQDPRAALAEVVVGYHRPTPTASGEGRTGELVIVLPEAGCKAAWSSARNVLVHAISLARGGRSSSTSSSST